MQLVGIGEIAHRAGVATSTIRYYEDIGLLPAPERCGGKRRYELDIVEKLYLIRFAQELGFSLTEIHTLLNCTDLTPSQRWHLFAQEKIAALDAQIEQAQRRKAVLEQTRFCTCKTLETCASSQ